MKKVALLTDSTAGLSNELISQYEISVVPLVLLWDGESYLDGVDIQPEAFYTRLQTAAKLPTTSQVSITHFQEAFKRLLEQDQAVLAVLLSSQLSGTLESALSAQESFPGAPITIIDSNTISMALGFQLLAAARAAEQGASLQECQAIVEQAREHTGLFFTPETLEFLHRGGRLGGGTRLLGTALSIKPMLQISEGHIEPAGRVRTRKKSLQKLIELVQEHSGGRQPIRLAAVHANALQEAQDLLEMARVQLNAEECLLAEFSPVVGAHTGPGTVGLAYMAGI
jgi:DegV family protein with EDD domain